jgi:hypothetical protein
MGFAALNAFLRATCPLQTGPGALISAAMFARLVLALPHKPKPAPPAHVLTMSVQ